jgi:hypothetical protein
VPGSFSWATNAEAMLLSGRASRALRDRFVIALDGDDYAALRALAIDLRSCTDILPRAACASLGLPRGSTYALAAMTLFAS